MITERKAMSLLLPGEDVYITRGGRDFIPAKIVSINKESLTTDVDELFYDEHGYIWFLTKEGAASYERKSNLGNG